MFNKLSKNKKGAAALISVVIVSAAAIIISRGLSFLTLSEIDGGVSASNEDATAYFAEGCIEETLRRVQLDFDYAATNYTLANGEDYCIMNITSNGTEKTIIAKAVHGNYNKSIETVINTANSEIDLISWKQIEN